MGSSKAFRFGPYEVDVLAGELRKGGSQIRLRDKSFDVLVCLLEHAGELVTREELRRRLWPEGVFVEFDNSLNSAVNRLRDALRDRARKRRYIDTVPRRGYRFLAPVEQVPSFQRQTLAVLPFANLNSDSEKEYFADGITDALVTELGTIRGLRVISRQSTAHFKGSAKALPEIGIELGADALVEGAVLHAGDRVRITAQLIRMNPEQHIWAQSYERRMMNILDIQRQIARAIAECIQMVLTPGNLKQLSRSQPVNPQAYEAFLKGGFYMDRRNKEGFQKAFEFLRQAIALDPEFAPAWGFAGAVFQSGWFLGTRSSDRGRRESYGGNPQGTGSGWVLGARARDPGWIALYYDWDFAGCERELNLALELNPNEWQAHGTLAVFRMVARGDVSAGLASTREMLQLDPLSLYTNTNAGWFYIFARDYQRASEHALRTIDMFPDALHAWYAFGQAKLAMRSFGEAIDAFQRAVAISRDAISMGYLGSALGRAGRTAEAEALLGELLERAAREYVSPKAFITLYAGVGDIDRAFQWIEEALRRRDSTVVFLDPVPIFDPLRGDARFGEVLQRVGLPPPWRPALGPQSKITRGLDLKDRKLRDLVGRAGRRRAAEAPAEFQKLIEHPEGPNLSEPHPHGATLPRGDAIADHPRSRRVRWVFRPWKNADSNVPIRQAARSISRRSSVVERRRENSRSVKPRHVSALAPASIPWLPAQARSTPQLLHAHATRTRAEIHQRTAPAHFAVHVALVLGEGRFQRMVHGDLPPTAARGQVESRLCRQVDRDRA